MRYLTVDFPAHVSTRGDKACQRCEGIGTMRELAPEQYLIDAETVLLLPVFCPWCAGCGRDRHSPACRPHGAMPLSIRDQYEMSNLVGPRRPLSFMHGFGRGGCVQRDRLAGNSRERSRAYAEALRKHRCWVCDGKEWVARPFACRGFRGVPDDVTEAAAAFYEAAREITARFEELGGEEEADDAPLYPGMALRFPCVCAMSRAREVEAPTGY